MVNFKQLILPLMVGILSIRAEEDEVCKFTVNDEKFTGINSCPENKFGYYYLEGNIRTNEGPKKINNPVFIKVTGANNYEEVEIPGYYKLVGGEYVMCKGKSEGCKKKEVTPLDNSKCQLGEIINQKGVVIGCNKNKINVYRKFAEREVANKRDGSGQTEYYLSKYAGPGYAFGFDADVSYYVIKYDENSITFDQSVSFEEDVMLDVSTGKVVTSRKEDFCSDNSSEHFYSCKNGKCTRRSQTDYNTIVPNDNLCTIKEKKVTEVDETTTFITENCKIEGEVKDSGYYIGKETNKDGEIRDVLCKIDSIENECNEPKDIARGYYWNNLYYNRIIRCDEHHCEEFKPDYATTCDGHSNQIIDTGYSVYYCKNDSGITEKLTLEEMVNYIENSEEQVKIDGDPNSIFDNADAYYYIATDDNSIKVDLSKDENENGIECDKGTCIRDKCTVTINAGANPGCSISHCASTRYDGYQFLDGESKTLADDQKNGFLVKLEKGVCSVVSQPSKPGFYLNQIEGLKDKYPLVYCKSDGCRLKKKTLLDIIKLPNGDETDNHIHYYYLNQEDVHNKPIIICWESEFIGIDIECKAIAATKTFYLNGSQNYYSVTRNVIACSRSDDDETITCEGRTMEGNKHYPIMDINGKNVISVMKCDGDECHEEQEFNNIDKLVIKNIEEVVEEGSEYVVINGFEPSKLIRCNLYKDNCNIIKGNRSKEVTDNTLYYIDSAAPNETLGLIKCNPAGQDCVHLVGAPHFAYISGIENKIIICSIQQCYYRDIIPGYYLNGGDGKVLIHYKDGKIVTEDATSKNQLFKNNAIYWDFHNYKLILCSETNSCNEIETGESFKEYLNIPENIKFTIDNSVIIPTETELNINENDKRAFVVNPNNFEILKNNSIEGKLVICNKVIKVTENEQKEELSCEVNSSTTTDQYYINGDKNSNNKLIISKDSKFKLASAGTGYYINSINNVIKCESGSCIIYSSKPSEKILTDGKCKSGMVGEITSEGLICVKEGDAPISTTSTGKYILSKDGGSNIDVLYNFDGTSVKVVKPIGDIYLVIKNGKVVSSSSDSGDIYKCVNNNNKYSCTREQQTGTVSRYYVNGDESTNVKYPKIKCEGSTSGISCNIQEDGANEIYCASNNNLYQCTTEKCPKDSEINNAQGCIKVEKPIMDRYYLNQSDNISLIKCEANACVKNQSIREGYYLSGNTSKPLIKCVKSLNNLRCIYETPANGYYVENMENNNKNIYQFDGCNNQPDGVLISCNAGFCFEPEDAKGWYVSSDKLIIHCESKNHCEKQLKPTEGWYVNQKGKSEDGKYLIKCTSTKTIKGDMQYNCEEKTVLNDGYYINAANGKVTNKKLIYCIKGKECSESDSSLNKYYVNGVNEKLIYCSKFNVCIETEPSNNLHSTWYLTNVFYSLIGCKSGKCKNYESLSINGYYMNGDPNTSKYPLIRYDRGFMLTNDYIESGWYKNGDLNAGVDEMMIRCEDANNCVYVEVYKDKKCEELTSTGFTIINGFLEWCNTDKIGFRLENNSRNEFELENGDNGKVVTALFKVDNIIPGVKLIGVKGEHYALTDISLDYVEKIRGEQHALVEITKDRVVSYKGIDGYYRYYNKLYECKKVNNGVCLKVEDVKDGFYRKYNSYSTYGEYTIYECNSNEYNLCKTINTEMKPNKFDFMTKLDKYVKELENNRIAAFDVEGRNFPGVDEDTKYILSEVNKYAIKYKEKINVNCEGVKEQEVNPLCDKKRIEYDYETNKGYYIFDVNKRLSQVYIPREDDTHEYKLYCKIDGLCKEKELSLPEVVNYRLSEDKILLAERNGIDNKEVVPLVLDGVYISKKSEGNYVKIVCKITGECEEKEIRANNGDGVTIVDGNVKFRPEGKNQFSASKMNSKYVLQKKTVSGTNRDEFYPVDTVLELKHNSYTWKRYESRNIFVNKDYEMITTEHDDIYTGYICKIGNCYEVPKAGKNYYINTIQLGSNINAYVECNNGYCAMRSLSEDNEVVLVPNGAANGIEDALIYCKLDKGCEIIATTAESGLQKCKLESYDENIYSEGRFKENGEKLSVSQFCLYEYNGSDGLRRSIARSEFLSGKHLYMFDENMENVDITKISRDYINASLYYCINGLCSRTYGYISLNDGYSKCDKSGCKIIKEQGSCKLYGAGSMSTKDSICIGNNNSDTVNGDNNIKYYAVSIDNEGSFPEVKISSKIIVGINAKFKFVLNEDGYVLITTGNFVGISPKETGKLYKCTSENMNCVEVIKPEDGIYKNIFSESVIKCEEGSCIIQINSNIYIDSCSLQPKTFARTDKNEYYVDNRNGYIYESTKQKITKVKIDDYILLKNDKVVDEFPERASKLYSCNSSIGKCTEVQSKEDGWYISFNGNGNAIYCENTLCYTKMLTNQCGAAGEMIYKNNNYWLCKGRNSNEQYNVDQMLGKVVNIGSSEYFGGSDYVNYGLRKIVALGKSSLSSSDTTNEKYKPLAACALSDKCKDIGKDEYCILNDSILYQRTEVKNQDNGDNIVNCTAKEGLVILYGNKEYVPKSDDKNKVGAKMYYCPKNGTSTSCRLVTGYYDDIRCDYEGCEIKKESPSTKRNGDWISKGKIRVGANDKLADEGKYYYITGENSFPGSGNKEGFIVQSGIQKVNDVNKSYFIIFKGEGYYLLGSGDDKMLEKDEDANKKGILYLCSESDLVCIEQKKAENGYYRNAKSTDRGKGIIICKRTTKTECSIAVQKNDNTGEVVETDGNSFNCTESTVGRIVRDKPKTIYKICYGNNMMKEFTGSATTVQYQFMTLKHGNKFASVELSSDGEKYKNDTATVLLKITNLSITQVNIEGYILSNSNALVENVSRTASGTLYYCEDKPYENQGKVNTHQCSEVKEKKSGWYFTDYFKDNRYIKCTESQCNVAEAIESNVCVGSGSLVYNGGKFKVCENEGKQVEVDKLSKVETVMMNVGKSAEFPSVKNDDTDIIVNRSAVNVTIVRMDSYVVVNEAETRVLVNLGMNKKMTEPSEEGALYKCESSDGCKKIQYSKDEWYLYGVSGAAIQLIYCNNRKCRIHNPVEGFFISANNLKPVIQCIQPGNVDTTGKLIIEEGKVKENIVCFERNPIEGWFVNNADDGLIRCTDEMGCERFDVANGWYMNAGATYGYEKLTNKTVTDIIRCGRNGRCGLYENEIKSSCTKGGEVVKVGNSYKVCKSSEENDFIEFSRESVEIIEVSALDDFPDADNGKTAVSVKKEKVVQASEDGYYYKNNSMYYCKERRCSEINDNESNEIVVLNVLSKTLYLASCTDNSCSWTEQKDEGYIFVQNKDGKARLYKNEGDKSFSNIEIYYCRTNNRVFKCNNVTNYDGYMYNPNHMVDGRKSNENLYLKTGNSYKLVSKNLRKCTEFKQNYCYISYENEPYAGDTDNYDSNTNLPKDIEAGSICINNNGIMYFATKTIDTGLDEKNCVEIPRGSDSFSYQRINVGTENEKVYLVDSYGARVAEEEYEYKGPSCTYDIKTGNCKAVGIDEIKAGEICRTTAGMNLLYLAKARVTNTGSSCTRYDGNNNDFEKDENVDRDRSKQYYLINGAMYSINSTNVEKMGEGIYYTDAVNYRISLHNMGIDKVEPYNGYNISISEDSNYKMYICNKNKCERKIKCNIEDGYEYLYNNENKKVVKCDSVTNSISEINIPGYYVNSISSDLIKCYNDGTCLEFSSDTAMEGYYKDNGNPMKMIKCVRNEEDFSCTEESIIECDYKEGKGTCSSKKDLLRNSYCYYRKEDKVYGIIEKYIYVSKFIKSGSEGRCVAGKEEDIFIKERNSKFVGHDEREDLIRVSIDSVVSIYEKDIGYYLIETKEGKGVVSGNEYAGLIPEKKTRFYVCRNSECVEEVPVNKRIYINKASSKKLVKFNSGLGAHNGNWNVIDTGCRMNKINTIICDIDPLSYSNPPIEQYNIVYKDQYDAVTLYDNVSRVKGKIRLEYHEALKNNTFIEYENNLYMYDVDGQSFTIQEGGPYIFGKPKNEKYNFNLVAYKSNRNETNIQYLVLPKEYSLGDEGYYINKADKDEIGIVIQKMNIEQKLEPAQVADDGTRTAQQDVSIPDVIAKYKAVINKCTSVKKNYCKTVEGTVDIEQGGVCVVTEGEFKGLYLAVEAIKGSSEGRNCIKYEEGGSYKYLDKEVLFSGQRMKNNIIKVSKDKIEPLRHDISREGGYETGIYVFTETEDRNLIKFNGNGDDKTFAYKCGKKIIPAIVEGEDDKISYACEIFNGESGYYITKPLGNYNNPVDVMEYKSRQWRNVSELGYYFFKEDYLPANITYSDDGTNVFYHPVIYDYRRVFGGVKINYKGKYLNKVEKNILVVYDSETSDESKLSISSALKKCNVNMESGICTNESKNLDTDDACVDQNGKLYVVDVIKSEESEGNGVAKCYTGDVNHLKYVMINEKSLYMLDGMSIKSMGKGFYLFDENMEAFTSKYPSVPSTIVYCNDVDQCRKITEKLDIDQDVLINEAKSNILSGRSLLRYYPGEFGKERFMEVKKNGYYCLNEEGFLSISNLGEEESTKNCWTKTDGGIKEIDGCDKNDICINYAKSNSNIVISNGKSKIFSSGLTVNYEKEYIKLNKDYNLDNSKVIYKMFEGRLYKLKKEKLEHVEEGLYILNKEGKAFIETEPTIIDSKLICYYVGGTCNGDELKKYREHKYVINRAVNPPTIVTYDKDKDKWATVNKDGYYFFFVLNNGQPYSIDPEDRRIYSDESEVRVKHIVDGKILDEENFNNGMYITEDRNEELVVGRVEGLWNDADYVVSNVEGISRRRCSAIEVGENIDVNEYCYSDKYGICMPKNTITDSTVNEANCISSDGNENYFYFINNGLYIANSYSYQHIVHNGLYVIDNENLPYAGRMEGESTAYLCEEGICSNVKELESTYYLNIAGLEVGENVILYFNSESNSWRKVDEDGNYLFNKNGYPVSAEEEITYYYKVSKNGNVVERMDVVGNKAVSKDGNVYSGPDGKAKKLESCNIVGNVVTANTVLEVGDLCESDGSVVVISGSDKSSKRQEGNSKSYYGMAGSTDGRKYGLVGNELVIVDLDVITSYNVNGYVIIDDKTMLPLESKTETEATVYSCDIEGCVVVDASEFEVGKNYINSGSRENYPLVKYAGSGKWNIENSEGYYFLDDKMKGVEVGVFAENIYEVKVVNGELKQNDISEENVVGFFLNKASSKKNVISNNGKFWSEGKELNRCNVSENKDGFICKTGNNNSKGYAAGDYCMNKEEQMYYLIEAANNETTKTNCVYGNNEKTKFVYLDKNSKSMLNGVSLKSSLIRIDQEAIKESKNGYYILDKDDILVNEVVPVEEEGKTQGYKIYKCDESGCSKKELASGTVFQTVDGKIYEIDEVGNIGKVKKDGLYFFDVDGDICDKDNNEVGSIINVLSSNEYKVKLNSMREGAYINEGNGVFVGVYENGQWNIVNMECEVDVTDGNCSSTKIDLELGSYCSVEGKFYVVSSIDSDGARKCIAGNNISPVFIKTENDKLVVVGEKGVFNVKEEEGYYAINDETLQALESEEPVKAQFVLCEFGGECKKYTPEVGRYINRSSGELNIAVFEEAGKSEASTIESKCTVEENVSSAVCNVVDGTLDVGDVCINENYIYVISNSSGSCLKAKKAVITYQIINNKMYMLTDDAVIQKNDGYFFINGDNRAIIRKEDYSKPDTVGYICSNMGDCYEIEPTERSYYTDYTTKSSKRYNVIKFDPSQKNTGKGKRDGNSGYEAVNEEGIYKLADGAYSECVINDIDEIDCHDIEDVGSYVTNEGEIIKCNENDQGEVECSQALEGGYYVIDGKLMECNVNEDGDQLVCDEMDKEGYFLAKPDGELWECVEKNEDSQASVPEDVEVSKVLDKLNAEAGDNGVEDSQEDSDDSSTTEVIATSTTEVETTTTAYEEYTPTPVAVDCAPIECKEGKVIYQKDENGVEIESSPIYVCKNVKDGENKFETECDSGNFIKGRNGYYICESDKSSIEEDKIEKPNDDHTKDVIPEKTTTSKSTTTTTKVDETKTTTTTTKTTTKPGTTTTKPTSAPTTAGAQSLYRKLPTFTFYLVIFVLSYFLFF